MSSNATIDLCENGPMIVNTTLEVDGETIEPGAALCRCGQSANKPYCDGTHNAVGFQDAGNVEGADADISDTGTLTIKIAKNGPILCTSPLTVRSADGATTHAASKAALCRCGQSTKKPFCDGTHGKVGFEAD